MLDRNVLKFYLFRASGKSASQHSSLASVRIAEIKWQARLNKDDISISHVICN